MSDLVLALVLVAIGLVLVGGFAWLMLSAYNERCSF